MKFFLLLVEEKMGWKLYLFLSLLIQREILLSKSMTMSKAASETDYSPSRMVVAAKCAEAFIRAFFYQNPLSHIGIIITIKDGVAQCLAELGGSPDSKIKALFKNQSFDGQARVLRRSFFAEFFGSCPWHPLRNFSLFSIIPGV